MAKSLLLVQGMHGMGDCLHQRAVLRQLMVDHTITLETSWPSIYHDLIAEGLIVVRRPVALRTQTKNAIRESDKFSRIHPVRQEGLRIAYGGAQVMKTKSQTVLEAMCDVTGTSYEAADYTLPIPQAWHDELTRVMSGHARAFIKPLLVYRPLVARPEWRGSMARNADPASYAELFSRIRDDFFVVSVADLEPGREWIVGPQLHADVALHSGELTFEALAALFSQADLVFTSSGFATILGPAVGTPTVSVVGGYEVTGAHSSGAKFAPYLAIGPKVECGCWTSQCRQLCDKSIDLTAGGMRLMEFVSENCIQLRDKNWLTPTRSVAEMFAPEEKLTPAQPFTRAGLMQQRALALAMAAKGRA